MKKKLTMKDIADMSGVAKSTVSRYFNGGYVKDDTRAKIKEIIEKYNYEPNAFAQSLKAKSSRIIGVIAPCLDSTVTSRTMMAIDEYLRKENYMSLVMNTDHDEKLELKYMESLWRMNVDGIILIATQVSDAHCTLVKKMDLPFVFVGQKYEDGISILYDDFRAGKMVGEMTAAKGHQDVVYIGVHESDQAVGIDRKNGILSGLKSNGVTKVEQLYADFSFDVAYDQTKKLLSKRVPDMIICATDNLALGAYKAIQEKGISIPDEISLIGFGGYEISSLLTPKLTTIRYDSDTAGYIAAETMAKLLKKEPVPKVQIVGYELLEGDSVKDMTIS